ncbi:MAG: hypothetical protein P5690_26265, partial [Limnospira sp. PMC 1236.20]|uniref:hypothetical protein n=1 Tax=Limnospira sp. PMC 1236.20 TaxID=2981034 RepID=UPI0028E0CBA9
RTVEETGPEPRLAGGHPVPALHCLFRDGRQPLSHFGERPYPCLRLVLADSRSGKEGFADIGTATCAE